MKKKLLLLTTISMCYFSFAQTTISYPQQSTNYTIFANGGGIYDSSTTELGMWANQNSKQIVGWRNFTETGLSGGTPSTMNIGDSFTITVNATQAYGQIGIALLSAPTAKVSWGDRHNNYAVQVNLNGPSYGAASFEPWEVVSTGGTINTTAISGSSTVYADFIFKFTLNSSSEMNVDINNGAETFDINLNNTNITGYSIYLQDDWSDNANNNIYWKPTTEYRYATTLATEDFSKSNISLNLVENTIQLKGLNSIEKFNIDVFDFSGKLVRAFNEKSTLSVEGLSKGIYIVSLEINKERTLSKKIIKK